jgi:hypothetical protein
VLVLSVFVIAGRTAVVILTYVGVVVVVVADITVAYAVRAVVRR